MDKIEADVGNDEHFQGSKPIRLRPDGVPPGLGQDRPAHENADHEQGNEAELDEPAVDDHVDQIIEPPAAEQLLPGMHRQEPLEWDEDDQEEQKSFPVEQVHAASALSLLTMRKS